MTETNATRAAGSSAPACSVCGSRKDGKYYSVGNVGITQVLPLCPKCKPNNTINTPRSDEALEMLKRMTAHVNTAMNAEGDTFGIQHNDVVDDLIEAETLIATPEEVK